MAVRIAIGVFYHAHLAPIILDVDEITYLALADAPAPHDPWWPHIRQRFTLLLHDYLGQLSEPLSAEQLSRARALRDRYQSPWAAEHLQRVHPSFDGSDRSTPSLSYVFPPLYTEDLLAAYAANARALREHLGVPLALEPIPTYLPVPVPQLGEPAFIERVLETSGCHLLLDIPHLVLSARTLRRSPTDLLAELPLARIIEIHVAGLAWNQDLQDWWVAPTPPSKEILDLAEQAAARAPALRAVTFDAFSPTLRADTLRLAVRLLADRFEAP